MLSSGTTFALGDIISQLFIEPSHTQSPTPTHNHQKYFGID